MGRLKSWLKNSISILVAGAIAFTSFMGLSPAEPISVVSADTTSAKSRVQTFIGLAAGKSGTSLPDIGNLTQNELQFLGVYLSNFYVPFSSEIGAAGQSEKFEQQKQDMITALSNNMNFNQEVVSSLIENVMGLSRSNAKTLSARVVDYNRKPRSGTSVVEISYWDFVNIMLGGIYGQGKDYSESWDASNLEYGYAFIEHDGVKLKFTHKEEGFFGNISESDIIEIGFVNGGSFNTVFDAYAQSYREKEGEYGYDLYFTPSQKAFLDCISKVDIEKGYVFDFFDFSEDDIPDGSSSGNDVCQYFLDCIVSGKLSSDDLYGMCAYGDKMLVDPFGSIIRAGSNHQTIIIPGCMNPYTWVQVTSSGSDVSSTKGRAYMGISLPAFSLQNSGDLIYPGSLKEKDDVLSVKLSVDKPPYEDLVLHETGKLQITKTIPSAWNWWNVGLDFTDFFIDADSVIANSGLLPHKVGINEGGAFSSDESLYGIPWYINRGNNNKDFKNTKFLFIDSSSAYTMALLSAKRMNSRSGIASGGYLSWQVMYSTSGGYPLTIALEDSIINKFGCEVLRKASKIYDYLISGCGLVMDEDGSMVHGDYRSDESAETVLLSNMCRIDNLGAFGFESSNSDIAYDAIQFIPYYNSDGTVMSELDFSSAINECGFSNKFEDLQRGQIQTIVSDVMTPQACVSLYTTYAVAGLYKDDETKSETIGRLGYRMNREGLPKISNAPLNFPSSYADDLVNTNIRNWIYYILHPTQGISYVKILIKNKVQAILVDWHNDMVGTNGVGITTGTTYYRTNIGYVTTPDLAEMQWTASLLSLYNSAIPILIIFMIVMMLLSFVTGVMSIQRCLASVLIFSLFTLVPINAMNYMVESTNRLTNRIYGDKFMYWALVQEETFGTALDTAATGDSYENYLKTLYATNNINQGGESIVLRWQAPKKMASLMLSSGDKSFLEGLQGNLLNGSVLGGAFSGEAYLDGDSQYMYRDYSDIANFSRYIYNSVGVKADDGTSVGSTKRHLSGSPGGCSDLWGDISGVPSDAAYKAYVNDGYTNGSNRWVETLSMYGFFNKVYSNAVTQSTIDKIRSGSMTVGTDYVGLNQDLFNVSLAYFNNTSEDFKTVISNNCADGNRDEVLSFIDMYSYDDYAALNSLMVYGLYSESPFYYFSWKMYDDGMSSGANIHGGYRSMLLGKEDGGYFYNMDGNAELKDFVSMRNLFTYVIPYLKEGNDVVRAWDERYGIFTYDGVSTDEGLKDSPEITGDPELKLKYWHNLNVARLYEIYTPWVDLMYDCSYAEPETIRVMGEKVLIVDPLDPRSYPVERPMIFSESEMTDYGLSENDLTKVEKKILEFNRNAQESMYELLNYYNFSDLSLNTAAAMSCAFEFNRTFSEAGLFSDNINLYPQNFEIKDFSYDAFLRFILATTTGESLTGSDDFYGDLVAKSSTTTAILLIILDILSQYCMPVMKVAFLVAIFISSVLLIIATIFKVDPEFKFAIRLGKQIAVPLAEYFAVTVGFAYVISLFMGVGNNMVTQSTNNTISLGDPNLVMVTICIIDIVCILLYVRLLMGIWQDIKSNFSIVKDHTFGLVGGMVALAGAGIAYKAKGGGSGSAGGSAGGVVGTGQESSRASQRSSKSAEDLDEKEDKSYTSRRLTDTERRTVNVSDSNEVNRERANNLNSTVEKGLNNMQRSSSNKK